MITKELVSKALIQVFGKYVKLIHTQFFSTSTLLHSFYNHGPRELKLAFGEISFGEFKLIL